MKVYGLTKEQFDFINSSIDEVFSDDSSLRVYLFGSRATGKQRENSDIDIAIKSKSKTLKADLGKLDEIFVESDLPYKVDLVDWDKIIDDYKPEINKQKRLIFKPGQKMATKWRICPIGEHWVDRHPRELKTGTIVDRDGHCRKNKSGKDLLKGEEIDEISKLDVFRNVKVKATKGKLKYGGREDIYDEYINGWTEYWNDVFKTGNPLHPDHVKILIATESGFRTQTNTPNRLRVGNAQGLVQLTEQTQKILKDYKGELKDHFVILKKKDVFDPNKNICAAIRWLFRKRETAKHKLKREPTWEEVLIEYKGITGQRDNKTAKRIRNDIHKLWKIHFP
jgi:predicted nucleotidyltransferase